MNGTMILILFFEFRTLTLCFFLIMIDNFLVL
jgi:hypothetical protein